MVRLGPPKEPPLVEEDEEDEELSRVDAQRIRDAWARLTVRRLPGEDIYARLPEINVIRCQWCRQPLPNMVARCQVCGGHA